MKNKSNVEVKGISGNYSTFFTENIHFEIDKYLVLKVEV